MYTGSHKGKIWQASVRIRPYTSTSNNIIVKHQYINVDVGLSKLRFSLGNEI